MTEQNNAALLGEVSDKATPHRAMSLGELLTEYRKGCGNTVGAGPEHCPECVAAFILALEALNARQQRAPVADERATVDPCGYVAVRRSAVDWLRDKFPLLTIKAGLCERIGGRLYTVTRRMRDHDAALASAPVAGEAQHPDDIAVDNFAAAMKAKLAKKRAEGRHGWQSTSHITLSGLLYEHMYKGEPLDVGNLAMMLHQNGMPIELTGDARRKKKSAAPQASEAVRNEALYLLREARALLPMFATAEAIGNWSEKVNRFAAGDVIDIPPQTDKDGGDAKAWLDLFWSVAKELNCLPSSFVDGNEHVLRAARQARAALVAHPTKN